MKKYPLKEGFNDFKVCLDNHDYLFLFGSEDKGNKNYGKDIIGRLWWNLLKSKKKKGCFYGLCGL